jgi:arylsulfatase A-like enzyme
MLAQGRSRAGQRHRGALGAAVRLLRRTSSRTVSRVGLFGLAALAACEQPAPTPDLLLISLDTLRADRLGCQGYERPTSPSLDALAARGVRFAEAQAPASQTAPSHMSLFTGLDPFAHGVTNVMAKAQAVPVLNAAIPTLPEVLAKAGFLCAALSDRGNLMPEMGFGRGFELAVFGVLDPEVRHKRLSELLTEVEGQSAPLFVFLHAYLTHAPYLPPKPFFGKFHDPLYTGEFRRRYDSLRGKPRSETFQESGAFLEAWPEIDAADLRFLSDLYDEAVLFADRQVARWLELYGQKRSLEETLVVVLSDHGEEFREHGRLGHRNSLHRELVAVPLILAGAGLPRGVVHGPFALVDLPATLCGLLGVAAGGLAGRSYAEPLRAGDWPALNGPVFAQLTSVYRDDRLEAVEADGWRLLREARGSERRWLLFDADRDPGELDPLEEPDRRAALEAMLDERLAAAALIATRHPTDRRTYADQEGRRELEALGYTEERDR